MPYGQLDHPRRRVGALLEATGFHPGRRARDHLRVLAAAERIPDRRVNEVLGQVDLAGAAGRRVRGFSLGMRQRLGIAAALLGDPDVLILDEPVNGLDPAGIAWLRGLLRRLAAEGRTIVLASHLLSEIAQTADHVLIVSAGQLRFAGPLRRDRRDQRGARVRVSQPDLGGSVPRTLTTEFRKLATVRSPWLLLALGPLIVVAGITGLVASGGNVHDPALQDKAFGHVGLAAIFTLVFGILAVAGEYSRGTITDTFLSFPRRRRVITAKLAAYGAVGAAAGLVSAATALLVTAAWWSAKGGAFHWSAAGTWETLGGGVAANAAFAAIGVGVGALVRNLVAAVAAALAWIAVVEGIAGQLIGSGPGPLAAAARERVPGPGQPDPAAAGCYPSGAAGWCCSATRWRSRRPRCSLHSSAMSPRKPAVLRDRDGENLREHLIRTAARLLDERGSAGLAVRDIAREAQVADGALYNYFEDKEDLLAQALLAHVATVMSEVPRMPEAGHRHRGGEPDRLHRPGHGVALPGGARVRRADVPARACCAASTRWSAATRPSRRPAGGGSEPGVKNERGGARGAAQPPGDPAPLPAG